VTNRQRVICPKCGQEGVLETKVVKGNRYLVVRHGRRRCHIGRETPELLASLLSRAPTSETSQPVTLSEDTILEFLRTIQVLSMVAVRAIDALSRTGSPEAVVLREQLSSLGLSLPAGVGAEPASAGGAPLGPPSRGEAPESEPRSRAPPESEETRPILPSPISSPSARQPEGGVDMSLVQEFAQGNPWADVLSSKGRPEMTGRLREVEEA